MDYTGSLQPIDDGSSLSHLLQTKHLLLKYAFASNRYKLSCSDSKGIILSIYDSIRIYVRHERVQTYNLDADVSSLTSRLEKLATTMALMEARITALKAKM